MLHNWMEQSYNFSYMEHNSINCFTSNYQHQVRAVSFQDFDEFHYESDGHQLNATTASPSLNSTAITHYYIWKNIKLDIRKF